MVRKFTSFNHLKSDKQKAPDQKSALKRHDNFKKVIKGIYAVKIRSIDNDRLK